MLLVQGHSGWMLWVAAQGCSRHWDDQTCSTGRLMAQGYLQPAVWGCDFPGRGDDGMRVCDTGSAERAVFLSVSFKEVDLQLWICVSSCTAAKPCSGGALQWLLWVDKTRWGGPSKQNCLLEPDSRVRARAGASKGQNSAGYLGISFRSQTQASTCPCFPRNASEGLCPSPRARG